MANENIMEILGAMGRQSKSQQRPGERQDMPFLQALSTSLEAKKQENVQKKKMIWSVINNGMAEINDEGKQLISSGNVKELIANPGKYLAPSQRRERGTRPQYMYDPNTGQYNPVPEGGTAKVARESAPPKALRLPNVPESVKSKVAQAINIAKTGKATYAKGESEWMTSREKLVNTIGQMGISPETHPREWAKIEKYLQAYPPESEVKIPREKPYQWGGISKEERYVKENILPQLKVSDGKYTMGKVYEDANGNRMKYMGKGKWQEVK